MATPTKQVNRIDLAKYTEGKKFTDGEHIILQRRDGSRILIGFRRNLPTELTFAPSHGDRVTVQLRKASRRKGRVPRSLNVCVLTVHRETQTDCTMTTPVYHTSFHFTIFGTDVNAALMCIVEDCDKFEDWF
jgi:hypothetical protein